MTVRIQKPAFNIREKLSELERPIGLKGSELMRAETAQEARELVSAGRKNILHNGAMQIYQRASSNSTGAGSSGAYRVHDRWFIRNSNMGVFTISNGSDLSAGFSNYIRWECTTADASPAAEDFLYMHQGIEGYNVQGLKKGTSKAEYSTLSFWVKSSEVGIFTVQISDQPNNRSCVKRYTIDSADTWEYKTLVFPPDTTGTLTNDNIGRLFITYWLGTGTNRTTGTNQLDRWNSTVVSSEASGQTGNIASSVGSYIQFTQIQYEIGKNATEFEHRSYGEELALCQRYYYEDYIYMQSYQNADQDYSIIIRHPTTMRSSPTITLSTPTLNVNVTSFNTAVVPGAPDSTKAFRPYLRATVTSLVEYAVKYFASSEL